MPEKPIQFHTTRLDNLRRKRSQWETQWEEVAERLLPAHKQTFHSRGLTNAFTPGRKNQEEVFDSTPALALQRFSAVIESLVTPQSATWHRVVPGEPRLRNNRRVRLYMDELNALLFRHRYRPAANFVGQSQKTYTGYGAYGNGLLFVDGQEDGSGLRYRNLHLGETYLVENHQGIVDAFYRAFHLEAQQIVSMFDQDGDTVPDNVKRAARDANRAGEEFEVVHVVSPRARFDPERVDALGMPWESLHFLPNDNAVLRESGFRRFPLAVARFAQFTNETYGRGPAQIVLPAIKVLNQEKKTVIKQGHRIVDPVLLAHDDGVVGTFSLRPGAINAGGVNSQGRPLVQPLPVGNIAVGQELMADERAIINDAFLLTLFQILVDTPQMTATEVLERAREKGMLIAPTAGRLQAEFLGPMIERELGVLFDQGLLPPPPPVLLETGGEFQIEYDNPLSRMTRAENAAGFMRSLDTALNFVQITQDLSSLDWFNLDVAMPAIQDINGAPTSWTRSFEEVQAIRAERARLEEEQRVVQAAPQLAGAAKAISGIPENQR